MLQEIEKIRQEALEAIQTAISPEEVEGLRVKYLGRKGEIASIMSQIPSLPKEQKPQVGRGANELKNELTQAIEAAQKRVAATTKKKEGPRFDPTLPGRPPKVGAVHPLIQTINDIKRIFGQLGFSIAEGPEVELQWYNFEALNIPADHPSRDDFDTFFVDEDVLLRSQTSTVQIRTMEQVKPPIRVIAPGKVFRPDTEDARHSSMFHQVEGLMVEEGVNFGDLKAVLHIFANLYFQKDVKMRFRPSFFPFTEPSAEVDISCPLCNGSGCTVCGYAGWLEVLGCGMVDPAVFEFVDYDAERYTGFAFGMGVERLTMIKYQIEDIRLFFQNDVRFLAQFA